MSRRNHPQLRHRAFGEVRILGARVCDSGAAFLSLNGDGKPRLLLAELQYWSSPAVEIERVLRAELVEAESSRKLLSTLELRGSPRPKGKAAADDGDDDPEEADIQNADDPATDMAAETDVHTASGDEQ